jgi:para-nitrobenzyl esterase
MSLMPSQYVRGADHKYLLLVTALLVVSTALTACGGGSSGYSASMASSSSSSSSGSSSSSSSSSGSSSSSSSSGAAAVTTSTGTFLPVASPTNSSVNVFYGIRYAAPPEGSLRWAPPTAPTPPSGTVTAGTPGSPCPQAGQTAPSEDCLFLNVWTPANATATSQLPVFLWIHGGALLFGTGASYNPSTIVQNSNVIVVTINYRLGALGWLVEPGLVATAANTFQNSGDAGDYGLMDQQFAMQWVQTNIAAFGGDPTKVTIGGESAGGLSVTSQLTSTTTAAGLFSAAIIESGGYMLHDVPSQSKYQSAFGAAFDTALGCTPPSDGECLRNASVSAILSAQQSVFGSGGIAPDTGTRILPSSLNTALTNGAILKVPVLQGTNANEGRLFEPALIPTPNPSTPQTVAAAGGPANFELSNPNTACASNGVNQVCTYQQEINQFLGHFGFPSSVNDSSFDSEIASDYALATFPDPYLANSAPSSDEALSQIFTDLVFACNGLDSNTALSQVVTVYGYEFDDPNAPPSGGSASASMAPNDVDGFPSGSEHASELAFIFDDGAFATLSVDEQKLASAMKTYWGNFIATNNPNSSAVPTWPAFTSSTTSLQNLVPGPQTPAAYTTFPAEHFCSTWEQFISAP